MEKHKLFIIAGEVSGDLHGANLIRHLVERSKSPLEIYGVGGDRIRETGALEFYDLAHFHVTGITAAIQKLPKYKAASKIILESIARVKPDLVVLIDNPGFNLHLSKKIHAMGIPIVYFIAPQIWAWGQNRVFQIKKYIRKVLVVFQFEKKFFEAHGVPVSWVGHPLKDLVEAKHINKHDFPTVTLMPGSRKTEIRCLLSVLLETAEKIRKQIPGAHFNIIQSPALPLSLYESKMKGLSFPIRMVQNNTYDEIASSDLVIACSGTATLECAILGTPMMITNRGGVVTYMAAKMLIRVPYLGLPNLILGEKKFPEFLQYEATPEKISAEAVHILTDEFKIHAMKSDCKKVSNLIGEKGASARAADEILALLS